MSFASLLNQSVIRKGKSGNTVDGRRIFGADETLAARVELKEKRKLLPNGNVIVTAGRIFLGATIDVNHDDQFTYDGIGYKVFAVYKVPGRNGQTHHIEVEMIKSGVA